MIEMKQEKADRRQEEMSQEKSNRGKLSETESAVDKADREEWKQTNSAPERAERESDGDNDWSRYRISDPQVNACCPTDCTGVLPTPPQNEEEMDSYLDVYQFQPVSVSLEGKQCVNSTAGENRISEDGQR